MSDLFERELARHVRNYLQENQPRGGQILLAEFHNSELADAFAEALVSEIATSAASLNTDTEESDLPVFGTIEGTPVFLVRVVPEVHSEFEPYEVTQGFATKMRNEIAASVETGDPVAMIMVLETDTSLDTLEASEELFGEDAPINLISFRNSVLDPATCKTRQGRAILRGLLSEIADDETYSEDIEVLETLCQIRAAVDDQNVTEIQHGIGDLPQFIREDQIGSEWFKDERDEETLAKTVDETLDDNRDHAEQLRRAHRAGTDTESRLSSTYTESFVNAVLESGDWSTIPHSEARKGRDSGGGPVRFDSLSVEAKRHRLYSPPESDRMERSVVSVADDSRVRLTAAFVNDLGDTPMEFVGPDGNELERLSKREESAIATAEDLNSDRPWFGQLLLYVGKKTTRGKPTHVFKLAVVPEWFFVATDAVSLDVDVEEEALVSNGDDAITLQPLEELGFSPDRKEVDLREDTTLEFDSPLTIDPNPPDVVERVSCYVAPGDRVPVRIDFLTEVSTAESEEVILPLMLAAIVEPDRWAAENFKLPSVMDIDTDRGEIYSAGENGIRLEEEALELLQIEEQIIEDRTILPRTVDGDDVDFGTVEGDESGLPEDLVEAYGALFDHFDRRNHVPSTDVWDDETKGLVEEALDAYVTAIDSIDTQKSFDPYELLRSIGTVRSTTTSKVWLTPFHPLLLSYGLRIAEWRDDELVPEHTRAGFRREQFISKFNANGLHPYRTTDRSAGRLLRGMPYSDNPLWTVYSPVESPGSVTPRYMERVVRDKLYTFVQAFPTLFQLHPGRQLVINLINMGDLRPVVQGLYQFYRKLERTDVDPPRILLRIYGGESQGDALERFFTESANSRLRQQLEKKNDELVDVLRSHVTYVRADDYVEGNQKEAHLTFFRGLLEEKPGVIDVGEIPSGMLNGGLFPRESLDVDTSGSKTIYTVGFSCDDDERELIHEVARRVNALEAGEWTSAYRGGQTVKKNIESTRDTDLTRLWDDSLWVVHVQPNVGIEFYVRSDTDLQSINDRVMIHYSDQYDSSSPDYDVITSTNKRMPYLTALRRALESANLGHLLEPNTVLSVLVAIDGELALDLQRSEGSEIVEMIGFVGGLALSQRILERSASDHLWLPLNLNELSRHDSSYKGGEDGLLQYDPGGKASDDLCFVGVPRNAADHELKLWLVETKGGSAGVKKGREQILGARENLAETFHPSVRYADDDILHGEFGKIVLDVARRLRSYDVITDDDLDVVEGRWRRLLEGEFSVSFMEDSRGHVGEVIRVRKDKIQSEVDSDGQVRTVETPIDALAILEGKEIEDLLPDLDVDRLTFHLDTSDNSESERSADPDTVTASTEEADQSLAPPRDGPGVDSEPRSKGTGDGAEATDFAQDDQARDGQVDVSGEQDPPTSKASSPVEGTPGETSEQTEPAPTEGDEESGRATETVEENPPETNVGKDPTTGADSSQDPRPSSQARTPDEGDDSKEDNHGSIETRSVASTRLASILERLQESPEPETTIDKGALASNLRDGFESLGVEVYPPNPSSISIGPRKVGVNVLPKEGQKIEGILSSLDSLSVHIQAHGNIVGKPIPSEGAVRLEIPHDNPKDIYLREGLEALAEEINEPLTIPLGVDTERKHRALSLPEERHALIAGATGSGKSNFLGTVISTLAVAHDPSEVKITLLDPKGVDFGKFQTLPHVETYEDTANGGVRKLLELIEDEMPERRETLRNVGASSVAELNENAEELDAEPIPYHVVVIDEYADLIMSTEDEDAFESAVTRLAQVGRALGFIILLATQRPSADIVSGKIKANFPCRISFRLPSNTDSRVILDKPGAEDLQGAGDMIALTQAGDEYHLQGYRLTLKDAKTILEWAVSSES